MTIFVLSKGLAESVNGRVKQCDALIEKTIPLRYLSYLSYLSEVLIPYRSMSSLIVFIGVSSILYCSVINCRWRRLANLNLLRRNVLFL